MEMATSCSKRASLVSATGAGLHSSLTGAVARQHGSVGTCRDSVGSRLGVGSGPRVCVGSVGTLNPGSPEGCFITICGGLLQYPVGGVRCRVAARAAGFRLFSDAYFSGCECARQNRACTYILYCQGAHMPGTTLTYSEERRRKRRRSTYSACAASERRKHRKFCGAFGATHGNDFRKCFYHKKCR